MTRTPPPPFPQVDSGGCYREKFFLILFFVSPIRFLLVFYFFIFSDFRLVYPILGFQLNRFQNIVSTRCNISLCIFSFTFRFMASIIILDSVFSILYFDSFLLVIFSSHQFRLVSALFILCFDSLTLLLVTNKHLCLCEFVLCLIWLF